MIKIGMCDDNLNSIKIASKLLEAEIIEQDLDAEISIISSNQKEIFDAIYKKSIDVLFLDIDFKNNGKNGIEFAKDLRKINKNFFLVFLSAHQRYLHLSLTTKVFDYLVKPINRDTVCDIVTRLKDEFSNNNTLFLHLNKWEFVRTDDILYIEKYGKKSTVFTSDSTYSTNKGLNTLLTELPQNFIRCHKSYILNKEKILSIDKKTGHAYFNKTISCPISTQLNV
jgi:two-component system response regulator AgrA